jgi:serine/threonine protein kinase
MGSHGTIYFRELSQQKFAIKCIPSQHYSCRNNAIKEYFLTKVASFAGIGPKVESYFGFDILIFADCIEFGMERCERVNVHNSHQWQLYENMALMHQIGIIHQDIKPENIMFSPTFDRPIFIDFGLSRIVSEKIGFKTLTNYVGCINYWGPEMSLCFTEKTARHVDLYYNDLFSLEASVKSLKYLLYSSAILI